MQVPNMTQIKCEFEKESHRLWPPDTESVFTDILYVATGVRPVEIVSKVALVQDISQPQALQKIHWQKSIITSHL